ncbi:MAG: Uncharacterised protein [Cyanobium sp. ARS6]|nr:MAG: Uncharacterised protein [Cyanobium sp. ARS6]
MPHELLKLLHDQARAGLDLLLIRVARFLHVALRNTVGTEEHVGLMGVVAVADLFSDQLSHRRDVAGVIKPAPDAADRQLLEDAVSLAKPLQLPET